MDLEFLGIIPLLSTELVLDLAVMADLISSLSIWTISRLFLGDTK